MKFGGSCLDRPSDIKRMIEIVRAADQPKIVLSAFKGVTDELIRQTRLARAGSFDLEPIEKKHRNLLADLPEAGRQVTETRINQLLRDLEKSLATICTSSELTAATMDEIVSYGERLAVQITSGYLSSEHLENSPLSDFQAGLITDSRFGNASLLDESYQLVRDKIQRTQLPIIAGFFGRNKSGRIATLGRGGTDYIATFIASALHCDSVLFKDVEGVMSADPKIVKDARLLTRLDYPSAMELAHYGSKAIFEKAITPAMKNNIAIRVTSFLNSSSGTLISERSGDATAVSLLKSVACFKVPVADQNMIPSLKREIEASHADNLLLTVDADSNEILMAVSTESAAEMASVLDDAFPEIGVKLEKGLALVAVTGSLLKPDDVREILLKEHIDVHAVSPSASGRSVCALLGSERAEHAVRILHSNVMT